MSEKRNIRVIVKEPGKDAEVKEILDEYKTYNNLVGGFIETITIPGVKGAVAVLNDEGKLNNLASNIFLPEYDDMLVGTIVVTGFRSDGEFCSLSDEQVEKVSQYISSHDARGYTRGLGEFENITYINLDSGENMPPFYELLFGEEDAFDDEDEM
jgi:hypothetical protein